MVKSMTAYGRFSFSLLNQKFTFEIHSLNKKNLDLSIFLPRDMFFLDVEIRKWVKSKVFRGQVTVKLMRETSTEDLTSLLPDYNLFSKLKSSWETLAQKSGFSKDMITISFLLEQYEKLNKLDEKAITTHLEDLRKAFDQGVSVFMEMKVNEGKALEEDILNRLSIINQKREEIEVLAKSCSENFEAKLTQKITQLKNICDDNEEKIAREVVVYADKVDISEELLRLKSHIKQFKEHLKPSKESIGKTLDFLVLEMSRETNTILAKTPLIEVTKAALNIKSELEKIREQVQNIE